jgi:hypothetical protein
VVGVLVEVVEVLVEVVEVLVEVVEGGSAVVVSFALAKAVVFNAVEVVVTSPKVVWVSDENLVDPAKAVVGSIE